MTLRRRGEAEPETLRSGEPNPTHGATAASDVWKAAFQEKGWT